jgi:hypothetical protein
MLMNKSCYAELKATKRIVNNKLGAVLKLLEAKYTFSPWHRCSWPLVLPVRKETVIHGQIIRLVKHILLLSQEELTEKSCDCVRLQLKSLMAYTKDNNLGESFENLLLEIMYSFSSLSRIVAYIALKNVDAYEEDFQENKLEESIKPFSSCQNEAGNSALNNLDALREFYVSDLDEAPLSVGEYTEERSFDENSLASQLTEEETSKPFCPPRQTRRVPVQLSPLRDTAERPLTAEVPSKKYHILAWFRKRKYRSYKKQAANATITKTRAPLGTPSSIVIAIYGGEHGRQGENCPVPTCLGGAQDISSESNEGS